MRKLDWRAGLAAGLLAVATSLPMQAADTVYKWVGEDGTTHYGTRPPNGVDSTAIKPKTGHSEPVDYSHLSGTEEQEQTDRDESSAEDEASTPSSGMHIRSPITSLHLLILEQGCCTLQT